ncbi:hypothetical protein C8A01DRAFT_21562, partial [Parachaetomium inaequale]
TTIPNNTASSDPYIINAFKVLDEARVNRDITLSRLAYIQLAYIFELLKEIVALDRRNGQLLPLRTGYYNASIATNIYIEAQEQASTSRNEVKQYSRVARRWKALVGLLPIFVILYYSEVAEGLIYILSSLYIPLILTILKQ